MSKTRPKAYWHSWKTTFNLGKNSRRINRKGQRRIRDREARRDIEEQK